MLKPANRKNRKQGMDLQDVILARLSVGYTKTLETLDLTPAEYFALVTGQLIQQIDSTLPRLEKHQYDNETLATAREIGASGVC